MKYITISSNKLLSGNLFGCSLPLFSLSLMGLLFSSGPSNTADAQTYDEIAPVVQTNCASCHVPPPEFHSSFDNVQGACERCHSESGVSDKGWPDLSTQAAVEDAVALGVFRQWIQPGGLMGAETPTELQDIWPPHLTPDEVGELTAYADALTATQPLGYDPILIAAYVDTPPVVDGDGSDAAWDAAPEHLVSVVPTYFTAATQFKMKAVYTMSDLYMRMEYQDSTMSMTRGGSWLWTGVAFEHPPAPSEDDKQSEDRVAFVWNKTIPDFIVRHGCAYKCHGNIPGASESYTDMENERADIWHGKAERGLGTISASQAGSLTVDPDTFEVTAGQITMNGFLDDKHLVWYNGPGFDDEDQGRRGDDGSKTYLQNRNSAKTAPLFMESSPSDYIDAMVLTQAEIDEGETIVADPDDPGYAGDEAVSAAWEQYAAFTAVVPERFLRFPEGSRGDALMSGTWSDAGGGTWVVEIERALDTGHPEDDIIFDDLGKDYEFGVTVFDNSGRGEVPPGHTTFGDGQYQVLRFATQSADPILGGAPIEGQPGWFQSDWFGVYNTKFAPWIFHFQHGFLYRPEGSINQSTYFFDSNMNAWWWTTSTVYPFLFAFDPPADAAGTDVDAQWIFYFKGSSDPRSFAVMTGPLEGSFLSFEP